MGWLFTEGQTRAELIASRTRTWTNHSVQAVCLTHAVRGNVLWTVWEHRYSDGRPAERFIGCDLLQCQRDYGWGYKDMEESMGLYYFTCPLSFLDLAPVADQAWRDSVRAYHAKQQTRRALICSLKVGDRVTLHPNTAKIPEVVIERLKPLAGRYQFALYRIKPSLIAAVISPHSSEQPLTTAP